MYIARDCCRKYNNLENQDFKNIARGLAREAGLKLIVECSGQLSASSLLRLNSRGYMISKRPSAYLQFPPRKIPLLAYDHNVLRYHYYHYY